MTELNAALIGFGMVAPTYLASFRDLVGDVRLVGALGRDPAKTQAFVANTGARAYGSLDDLIADHSIDFAILITPPDARAEFIAPLAAAGIPVLMEKPVERTHAAALKLTQMMEAEDLPFGITLQHRARPAIVALKAAQDDLGALRAAEISVPWWREQSYYDAPGRGAYARDGGGVMITQAIHAIDLALHLTGPVRDVTAMTATTGFHEMEAEDFAAAGLTFQSGAVGTLFATTAAFPGRVETIDLHYANGSARLLGPELTIHWRDGRVTSEGAAAATGAGADPMAFTHDWHRSMIADFANAVRSGATPLAPARSALPAHALIEAIERSARIGARAAVEET